MEQFQSLVRKYFYISLIFFALGLIFGLIYSINLLGFSIDSKTLLPLNLRSIHISLMLYGFIPLMLSYLPFFLMVKDLGFDEKGAKFLEIYTIIWYFFLLSMVFSFLFGVHRGLVFYDFDYKLNFILAFAGLFYLMAFYRYTTLYEKKPLWVKIALAIIALSPLTLLILMNPQIGQVEETISANSPHGDHTLGMSLALILVYYLVIKYLSNDDFKARWHIFWIIPAIFYALSVAYRAFVGNPTYNMEWFFQWLTLFYVPLLYRWYKDAKISNNSKKHLLISIAGFLFVDIEGNLLFIPSIRWLFHRNDLVIAHAHIAVGVGVLFLTLSLYSGFINELGKFIKRYLVGILGIFISLSIAGFVEAGFLNLSIDTLWLFRTIFGLVAISSLFAFINVKIDWTPLKIYNVFGVLSDGVGGIILFLAADYLYPLFGFKFSGVYEYIVFGFVITTGVLHYLAFNFDIHSKILTKATIIARVLVSSIFLALFLSNKLGLEALAISLYDVVFALIYLVFIYKKEAYRV